MSRPKRNLITLLITGILASFIPIVLAGSASAARVKTIAIKDASIVEGDAGTSSLVLKVVWTGSKGGGAPSASYATADVTATAGSDYTAKSGTVSLTNGGCRCGTISIAVKGDNVFESTETFAVNLSSPVNGTIGDGQGIGTIYDNEGPPSLIVTDTSAAESDTNAVFSVLLTSASPSTVTVDYATLGDTAVSGTDFSATSGTLTFTTGQTSKTVDVPLSHDALSEDDEMFSLGLSSASGAGVTSPTGAATIVDDDAEPTLSVGDVSVAEGDAGTTLATFTVTLSAAAGREVAVDYATSDTTATAGLDYVATSGSLTFLAGQTSATVDVGVYGDGVYEGNETFDLTLSAPVNGDVSDGTGVGTITEDEAVPALAIDDTSVTEGKVGTTTASFTLSMTTPSATTVSVGWATADGTALSGEDFVNDGGTAVLGAGVTSMSIDVTVNGDATDEPNETFLVTLSSPSGATVADGSGTGTITDDDPTPTTLTLKEKKTTRSLKAIGVIESAATGMKVKVTLSKKRGARYVRLITRTVTVSALGDRDGDGKPDAVYAARFKRPPKGAYRFQARYAGNADYRRSSKTLRFMV